MNLDRPRAWSGTGRRLFLAFSSLIGVFSLASYLALSGMAEVQQGLRAMREREEAVHLALQLASAVRDQYAHQAHTIILGNASHLGFYEASHKQVLSLAERVRGRAGSEEEREEAREIERSSGELDQIFREQIVPAVLARDPETVHREHGRGLLLVTGIQGRVDRLVERFERSIAESEQRAHAVEHRTFALTLAFLTGSLLLAVAIGLYIGRSVAVPIARLGQGAAALGRGELDTRIELESPDEFGDLARQFNAMTAALKDHQDRLVQTEKMAGIGRLAAGVAHEINNPLGVILGYARVLRKKAEGGLAEDLKVIEDETLRCREIVEGLLDLSRPVKGGTAPVDLRVLCEETIERLRETPVGSQACFEVRGEALAAGAPGRLRQVVFNLLKNAAEATGPQGQVALELTQAASQAILAVRDGGPGVPAEARARLFEPFFTTKPSGTGLGLAVSRAIARAHGGDVEAAFPEGGGALVTLKLPAAPALRAEL
ncbi:MAG: HAMP domain-containing protein [Deltaproteobacteria bacterium]|nr:HAMP domain-containing protein [Deltaproteobacteria bacterium]